MAKAVITQKQLAKVTQTDAVTRQNSKAAVFNYFLQALQGVGVENISEMIPVFRDALVNSIASPEYRKTFSSASFDFGITHEFDLLDQAVLDNIFLCIIIKAHAPDSYQRAVKIIDKYVRPVGKRGFNRYYQECAGLLIFLLRHYQGLSERQAIFAVAQLFHFSDSTVEKPYRARMKSLAPKLGEDLPPLSALLALYFALHTRKADPEKLSPFKKNTRSQKEADRAKAAYWQFTEKVIRHYQDNVLPHAKAKHMSLISMAVKEFGIVFPLPEKVIRQAPSSSVLAVLFAAYMATEMPKVLDDYLRKSKTPA